LCPADARRSRRRHLPSTGRPAGPDRGRQDGTDPITSPTEDDVTDPGAASEADLAEQEDLVDGTAMGLAGAVAGPEDDVPEADAL
jgi:hypothetical protein